MKFSWKQLIVLICGIYIFIFTYTTNLSDYLRIESDFYSRWYSVRHLLSEGRNLYDTQNAIEISQFKTMKEPIALWNFYYPAHFLILLVPLSILPYPLAHILWMIIILLSFVVSVLVFMSLCQWPAKENQTILFFLTVLVYLPAVVHNIWGQFNSLGMISLAFIYFYLKKRAYFLAGVAAVVLTFKPQAYIFVMLFFLLWAVFKKERWAFIFGFSTSAATLLLLSLAFQPDWIFAFLKQLQLYPYLNSTLPIIDQVFNTHGIFPVILLLTAFITLSTLLSTPIESPLFIFVFPICLSVNWLVIPLLSTIHLIALPFVIIPILSILQQYDLFWYKFFLAFFIVDYVLELLAKILAIFVPNIILITGVNVNAIFMIIVPLLGVFIPAFFIWPVRRKMLSTSLGLKKPIWAVGNRKWQIRR